MFERKLQELDLVGDFSRQVLQEVGNSFTLDELRASLSRTAEEFHARNQQTSAVARKILMLAQSNYEVQIRARLALVRTRALPGLRPPRATASRTPASFAFNMITARKRITPLTPPTTAK